MSQASGHYRTSGASPPALSATAALCRSRETRLLDRQSALHTAGLMARDRAVEGVGAGLEADADLRGAALAHPRTLLAHPVPLARDVVGDRRLVRHHERDLAGIGRRL